MPKAKDHQRPIPRPVALADVLEQHLEKVLSSRVFKTADNLRELLRFTVGETSAGRGGHLKEYVLGAVVLGKGDSFDPKADPIVRVQMGRLRQHLNRYYATEGRYDLLSIEIPKGTYTATFRSGRSANPVPPAPDLRLMVGRDKELADLRSAFESAAAGRGGLFCLAGEPGIGKTTVVDAFLEQLATSGVDCHLGRGRCSERLAGSEAYLPLLEALETLRGCGGEALGSLMKAIAPTWYRQIAPLGDDFSTDGVPAQNRIASRERLKRELMTLLEELARRSPVVLFLDDLHWADASTTDIVGYIGSRCDSHRILIVGAYRPSDMRATDHPFQRVKLELQGHSVCREFELSFLTRADVDRYLGVRFPDHLFPTTLSAAIHDRTEGNPLFMVDLVRYFSSRGMLAEREGRWIVAAELPAIQHELPESVRSMIQKKIHELTDADRRLMTAAAVQGQEFDSVVVAKALDLSPADVEERFDALDRTHGLVRLIGDCELPDSTLTLRYAFVHVLYQDALHSALTPTRKASLSLAVAGALTQLHRDKTRGLASQLALLFEAGRDFGRASDFFLTAAQNAALVYAATEAIALSRRAIHNAEKLTGPQRHARVLAAALHSADQHQSISRFDEAIADFELAEKTAAELGDCEAQVRSMYGEFFALLLSKRLPGLPALAARAHAMADTAGSRTATALSDFMLAIVPFGEGTPASAKELLDRATPILRECGPSDVALDAAAFRAGLHTFRLEHDEANRDLTWVFPRAAESRAAFTLLQALFHTARTRGNEGRLSEAWETLDQALRLSEQIGDRHWRPRIANTRGWILQELLDPEPARRLNTDAVRMALELGDVEAECNAHINAARDFLAVANPQQAWEHLQRGVARYEEDTWYRWIYYPRLQAEMASYWICRGDLVEASSCVHSSLEHAERTTSRKRIAWAHKLLGDIAMLENRPGHARREFDVALQILEGHTCPTIEWRVLAAASVAASAERDDAARDQALAHARFTVQKLADSIWDHTLRQKFLHSKPIRELGPWSG